MSTPQHEHTRQVAGGRHSVEPSDATETTSGAKALRALREVTIVVVAAVVLSFLLKTFLIQSFTIPSQSMEPTLHIGDRVIVTKLTPGPLSLHRGDIVVFTDPGGWVMDGSAPVGRAGLSKLVNTVLREIGLAPADSTEYLIKRVIGLPGDVVACEGAGQPVTVNGVALNETYLPPNTDPSTQAFEVTVTEARLWVMGDNRNASSDSRSHQAEEGGGSVSQSSVVGVAQLRSWPPGRWSTLRNPGSVFADVPAPGQAGAE